MDKKGMEFSGVGALVILAVAVIVVMSLLPTIAGNVASETQTVTYTNRTVTAPAAGSSITLPAGQAYTNVIVTNASSGDLVPASNYTITNYVVAADGTLTSTLTAKAGSLIGWQSKSINISATVEPYGYDTNAGGRTITNLVVLLTCLAIAVVAIAYVVKNNVFDM